MIDWYNAPTMGNLKLAGNNNYSPSITGTTIFYAESRNETTTCVSATRTAVTATMNPVPLVQTVTGGGSYCSDGAGMPVGLAGSELNVNYQLRLNGSNTGSPVPGTGNSITFGNRP